MKKIDIIILIGILALCAWALGFTNGYDCHVNQLYQINTYKEIAEAIERSIR